MRWMLDALQADGGTLRFVRGLIGLDREAAKRAFTEFSMIAN